MNTATKHNPLSMTTCLAAALVCAGVWSALPRPTQALRASTQGYAIQVLVDGSPVRTFAHRGETFALGHHGARYVVRVHNKRNARVEAVVTVDGLDVLDGKAGNYQTKRGYIIAPYSYVDIDGWRMSPSEVASFRFGSVAKSYAAQTGSPRHVGVIGVALFVERPLPPVSRPMAVPESFEAEASEDADASYGHMNPRSLGAAEGRAEAAPSPNAPAAGSMKRSRSLGAAEERSASATSGASADAQRRLGLGTEFGERRQSQVRHVSFVRAHATEPSAVLGLRYDNRAGLIAHGIDVDGRKVRETVVRRSASPFPAVSTYAQPPVGWRDR